MCKCLTEVTETDCDRLKAHLDIFGFDGFCIYWFTDESELKLACVKKEDNPNDVALRNGFIDENGEPQWFYVKEHPCIK